MYFLNELAFLFYFDFIQGNYKSVYGFVNDPKMSHPTILGLYFFLVLQTIICGGKVHFLYNHIGCFVVLSAVLFCFGFITTIFQKTNEVMAL